MSLIRRGLIASLASVLAGVCSAQTPEACPAGRVPILILGTFHMSNPGEDAVNMDAGDMLSPRRQREIEDLVERLGRFAPTRVAIESSRKSTTWNERYRAWLDGKRPLGRNEIEQIGFRIAKRMKLEGLSPVDYPMWMNGLTPDEMHEPRPKPEAAPAPPGPDESPLMKQVRRQVAQDAEKLASSTVREYLAYLNSRERFRMNHGWDILGNLTPGDGVALYENTDLATNWYKRNLRIFTNLLEIARSGDRILLVIGAGHLPILTELASEHPGTCLVPATELLR